MPIENNIGYIKVDTTFSELLLGHYLDMDTEKVSQRDIFEDLLSVSDVTLDYLLRTDIDTFSQLISVLSFHSSSRNSREQFFKNRDENTHKLKMTLTQFKNFNLQLEEQLEEMIKDESFSAVLMHQLEACIQCIKNLVFSLQSYVPEFRVEFKTFKKTESKVEDLKLSGLPKFNLQQRYELFKRLGFHDSIGRLKTQKQGSRANLIALIMGISFDNARHLLDNRYKELSDEDEISLIEHLDVLNISLH